MVFGVVHQIMGERVLFAKGTVIGIEESNSYLSPTAFELTENYPNPFNTSTSIRYAIPRNTHIELAIYNIQGQLIRTLLNGEEMAGTHTIIWDGKDNEGKKLGTGIYFYQLKETNGIKKARKMLILR